MLDKFQQAAEFQINKWHCIKVVSESAVMIHCNLDEGGITSNRTTNSSTDRSTNNSSTNNSSTNTTLLNNIAIQQYLHAIQSNMPSFIVDVVASFNTLLVEFDAMQVDFYTLFNYISSLTLDEKKELIPTHHKIDVCFELQGDDYPNDLTKVSHYRHLSVEEIITLFCSIKYRVFALGFMPNFAYLGELPEVLATPRLTTPRKKVPAGALAIADRQTAIYPQESPGGWHIIGYTNNLESQLAEHGCKVGDSVEFIPCRQEAFIQDVERNAESLVFEHRE